MKLYQSQIDFHDIGVSVLVNDLPVFTDNGSGQSSGGTVLNPYLLGLPNPIRVVLTPLKGVALPPARATVDVQVLAYAQGPTASLAPLRLPTTSIGSRPSRPSARRRWRAAPSRRSFSRARSTGRTRPGSRK